MPTKNVERIRALVMKEMAGEKLEPEEKAELQSWLDKGEVNKDFHQEWKDWPATKDKLKAYLELSDWHDQRTFMLPDERKGILRRFNGYWLSAASVLLVCAVVILYIQLTKDKKGDNQHAGMAPVSNNLVLPARQQAVLSVAGGATYVLDSLHDGQQIDGAVKSANGSLEYLAATGKPVGEHSVSTPPGGFYNLVLSDGTHVWLNAASELAYLPTFPGDVRKVRLKGEAFFDVTKSSKRFEVHTDVGTVSVYGTTFNVKSYDDQEPMVATLEEGSVKIENRLSGESRMLTPGNQMQIDPSTGAQKFRNEVDVKTAIGWKYGLFSFDDTELPEVLKELERWYNVKVVYDSKHLPKAVLKGEFDRTMNLNDLARVLSRIANIHLKVTDNNTLLVQP